LYKNFSDYDQEPYTQGTQGKVDFIEQEIGHDRSKTILDVGCGTGRHALELARRGYQVVGLDLSESLLAQGRKAAQAENLDVTFIAGDARALDFEAQFDVALSICEGAFSLMEMDEMDLLILENVARALQCPEPAEGACPEPAEGACPEPAEGACPEPAEGAYPEPAEGKPGGKFILTAPNAAFMLTRDPGAGAFDAVTFRETFTLEATGVDGGKKSLDCTQRYYTCPELKWLLKQAGFRTVQFFGVTEAGFDRQARPSKDHFEIGVIAEG